MASFKFDLIYAAGLFDYLNRYAAMQLVQWMFEALNEGGHLLAPNFREYVSNTSTEPTWKLLCTGF